MIPNILQIGDNGIIPNEPRLFTSHNKTDEIRYNDLCPSIVLISTVREILNRSSFTRFAVLISPNLDNRLRELESSD